MFITCRRPRRLRSRMSPALLDPGGCPSVLGSYRRACSSIRSGIGGSAPWALGSSTLSRGRLAWPRVTGRLSSEVRPGVRVSGSRVRHVTTRDTSHGPSRRHVGRWVMLMRVRGRGTGRPRVRRTCRDVLRVLHTVTDSIIRKNAAASSETSIAHRPGRGTQKLIAYLP